MGWGSPLVCSISGVTWARHLARVATRAPLHDAHELLLVPLGQAPLLARIRRKLLHVADKCSLRCEDSETGRLLRVRARAMDAARRGCLAAHRRQI
jgi:hypothetical protein